MKSFLHPPSSPLLAPLSSAKICADLRSIVAPTIVVPTIVVPTIVVPIIVVPTIVVPIIVALT
jgi:hypothetical protein